MYAGQWYSLAALSIFFLVLSFGMDADPQTPDAERARRRGRIKLLVLAAFFTLPVAARLSLPTHGGRRARIQLRRFAFARSSCRPACRLRASGSCWLDAGACDAYCERKHYLMRQVRKAQGKDQVASSGSGGDRCGAPRRNSSGDRGDAHRVRPVAPARRVAGRKGALADHYLVDPLGNLMMRFPRDPDPKGMIRDLQRLLKTSRIG